MSNPAMADAPAHANGQSSDPSASNGQAAAPTGAGQGGGPDNSSDEGSFDPQTLDPALQPAYKSLQARYTKKFQNLSEEQKKLTDTQAQLAGLQSKGDTLDRLMAHPKFQSFLKTLDAGEDEATPAAPDLDNMTEEERIAYHIDKQLQARLKPVEQFKTQLELRQEIQDCERQFGPSFVEAIPKIQALMKDPTLANYPYAHLYRLVTWDDRFEQGKRETMTALEKKKAASTPPSGGSPAASPSREEALTFRESYNRAKTQHGG